MILGMQILLHLHVGYWQGPLSTTERATVLVVPKWDNKEALKPPFTTVTLYPDNLTSCMTRSDRKGGDLHSTTNRSIHLTWQLKQGHIVNLQHGKNHFQCVGISHFTQGRTLKSNLKTRISHCSKYSRTQMCQCNYPAMAPHVLKNKSMWPPHI